MAEHHTQEYEFLSISKTWISIVRLYLLCWQIFFFLSLSLFFPLRTYIDFWLVYCFVKCMYTIHNICSGDETLIAIKIKRKIERQAENLCKPEEAHCFACIHHFYVILYIYFRYIILEYFCFFLLPFKN